MLNNFLNAFSVDDTVLIYIFVDLHVDIFCKNLFILILSVVAFRKV